MTACTHSTVIEDARNSQPKESMPQALYIFSHQTIITMKLHNHRMLEREEVNYWSDYKLDMSNYIYSTRRH